MILGRWSLGFNCHWKIFNRYGMLEIERILEITSYINQTPYFIEEEILTRREL